MERGMSTLVERTADARRSFTHCNAVERQRPVTGAKETGIAPSLVDAASESTHLFRADRESTLAPTLVAAPAAAHDVPPQPLLRLAHAGAGSNRVHAPPRPARTHGELQD
ncbi:MAG: triphosphoribosyl-dephospho-CoA synthase MdcB, partial [Methanobacteriota archaeon]